MTGEAAGERPPGGPGAPGAPGSPTTPGVPPPSSSAPARAEADAFPGVPGLRLFRDAVPPALQARVREFVEETARQGRAGKLWGKTYTAVTGAFAERQQSRPMLHFGAYSHSNRVQNCSVLPLPPLLEEVRDTLVRAGVFRAEERPTCCTVNMYDTGQWIPPHVDSGSFARPFCTVSLLSAQSIVFGRKCRILDHGRFEGTLTLPLPVGSALLLSGEAADAFEHGIPPVAAPRISLTFRRLSRETELEFARTKSKKERRKEAKRERKAALKAAQREAKKKAKTRGEGGAKAAAVPGDVLAAMRGAGGAGASLLRLPPIEREHVQNVYDTVAEQWHGTRYRPWPRVAEFVRGLPAFALVGDLGCGNGKNAPPCNERGFALGCDFSERLVEICARNGLEVLTADALLLPYRAGAFDAVLSVAVLHHISSAGRRLRLVTEAMRVLRVGGRGLFYAWAYEQDGARSGHEFAAGDVFVPFHLRYRTDRAREQYPAEVLAGAAATHGEVDEAKGAVVFQRYCHVFREGELEALFAPLGAWVAVTERFYDTGNWCVVAEKTAEMPAGGGGGGAEGAEGADG